MFENDLYNGIPQLLTDLKEQHKILTVATSKPPVFSEKILRYFNIDKYFDLVVGSNLDGTRTSKTEVIQYKYRKKGGTKNGRQFSKGDEQDCYL